jgi:menaquinone-dependent protoporphyrinogen oxidase
VSAILVAFATKHGSTQEVAEAVSATLRGCGDAVDVAAAADVKRVDDYDLVVLGAALYAGRLHRDAVRFLGRHHEALATRPLAVFAMGPKTLAASEVAASRAQLERVLDCFRELEPTSIAIFGGVIDPADHRFPFSRLPASDARDWDAVAAWAREVHDLGIQVAAGG